MNSLQSSRPAFIECVINVHEFKQLVRAQQAQDLHQFHALMDAFNTPTKTKQFKHAQPQHDQVPTQWVWEEEVLDEGVIMH